MEFPNASEPAEPLRRPAPPTRIADSAAAWLDWFGVWRLVAAAVAVAVVCAGAYWLVRTPPPPSEAALPRASVVVTAAPPTVAPPPAAEAAPAVTVHVAGAVARPGVYRLEAGARVLDAIDAAGGAGRDANADALNLAAPVADGSRVYVPVVGEEVVAPPPADAGASPPSGPVDVNRASIDELDALPGVGPATAAAIVTERQRNGPFLTVDDLERVPGIGPAKLASLRDLVTT